MIHYGPGLPGSIMRDTINLNRLRSMTQPLPDRDRDLEELMQEAQESTREQAKQPQQ